mmetsp:Transcript_23327/g.60634  ORF Transcript_23327/g.60634 Transcript_23327/m.60634 type:complete len:258 (+) Transcript_23327:1118-1891(+)
MALTMSAGKRSTRSAPAPPPSAPSGSGGAPAGRWGLGLSASTRLRSTRSAGSSASRRAASPSSPSSATAASCSSNTCRTSAASRSSRSRLHVDALPSSRPTPTAMISACLARCSSAKTCAAASSSSAIVRHVLASSIAASGRVRLVARLNCWRALSSTCCLVMTSPSLAAQQSRRSAPRPPRASLAGAGSARSSSRGPLMWRQLAGGPRLTSKPAICAWRRWMTGTAAPPPETGPRSCAALPAPPWRVKGSGARHLF